VLALALKPPCTRDGLHSPPQERGRRSLGRRVLALPRSTRRSFFNINVKRRAIVNWFKEIWNIGLFLGGMALLGWFVSKMPG
jgi:hypothetical protein